ncbi:MAG: cysteine hydrolase [Pseudomonadota bacterium]|nr:cysteine hydrolase [Pseudomonadota bacterium]
MDSRTTALVLIEYQNDFVKEGGAQHEAVRPVMESSNMLANSLTTAKAARKRGVTVMHAPISFQEGYPEIATEAYGILAGVRASNSFRKGSWGAEIIDELAPVEGDVVIEGKRGLDCFASTNLDFILRARGITNVALAGFLTNCCVESTMRSAYERGYRVVTLTDCTATLSEEEQQMAVTKDFAMFSQPMTHDAFLAALQ